MMLQLSRAITLYRQYNPIVVYRRFIVKYKQYIHSFPPRERNVARYITFYIMLLPAHKTVLAITDRVGYELRSRKLKMINKFRREFNEMELERLGEVNVLTRHYLDARNQLRFRNRTGQNT